MGGTFSTPISCSNRAGIACTIPTLLFIAFLVEKVAEKTPKKALFPQNGNTVLIADLNIICIVRAHA
jgi:hypothetical protein